jgi:hypothetical protein
MLFWLCAPVNCSRWWEEPVTLAALASDVLTVFGLL